MFKILSFIQQNWRFTSDRLRFSFWNTQAGLFQHIQHENERPTFLFIPMSDITKYLISIPWTTQFLEKYDHMHLISLNGLNNLVNWSKPCFRRSLFETWLEPWWNLIFIHGRCLTELLAIEIQVNRWNFTERQKSWRSCNYTTELRSSKVFMVTPSKPCQVQRL